MKEADLEDSDTSPLKTSTNENLSEPTSTNDNIQINHGIDSSSANQWTRVKIIPKWFQIHLSLFVKEQLGPWRMECKNIVPFDWLTPPDLSAWFCGVAIVGVLY